MKVPRSQDSISTGFAAKQFEARHAIIATISQLPSLGISQTQCRDIEIVLAEAVNNVVEHACADLPDASGRIACLIKGDFLIIEISDTGRPIPEFRLPTGSKADLSVPIVDLPEGGFGWFLIRQITSNLSYERINGQNHLLLEFRTKGKTQSP